jgi:hypothetical protein
MNQPDGETEMRLTAALILMMTATGTLADEPRSVVYYGDEQGVFAKFDEIEGEVRQHQQQPYSGILGQTEGSNWRYRSAPPAGIIFGGAGSDHVRQPQPVYDVYIDNVSTGYQTGGDTDDRSEP